MQRRSRDASPRGPANAQRHSPPRRTLPTRLHRHHPNLPLALPHSRQNPQPQNARPPGHPRHTKLLHCAQAPAPPPPPTRYPPAPSGHTSPSIPFLNRQTRLHGLTQHNRRCQARQTHGYRSTGASAPPSPHPSAKAHNRPSGTRTAPGVGEPRTTSAPVGPPEDPSLHQGFAATSNAAAHVSGATASRHEAEHAQAAQAPRHRGHTLIPMSRLP